MGYPNLAACSAFCLDLIWVVEAAVSWALQALHQISKCQPNPPAIWPHLREPEWLVVCHGMGHLYQATFSSQENLWGQSAEQSLSQLQGVMPNTAPWRPNKIYTLFGHRPCTSQCSWQRWGSLWWEKCMLHISKEPSASICRQSIHHDISDISVFSSEDPWFRWQL